MNQSLFKKVCFSGRQSKSTRNRFGRQRNSGSVKFLAGRLKLACAAVLTLVASQVGFDEVLAATTEKAEPEVHKVFPNETLVRIDPNNPADRKASFADPSLFFRDSCPGMDGELAMQLAARISGSSVFSRYSSKTINSTTNQRTSVQRNYEFGRGASAEIVPRIELARKQLGIDGLLEVTEEVETYWIKLTLPTEQTLTRCGKVDLSTNAGEDSICLKDRTSLPLAGCNSSDELANVGVMTQSNSSVTIWLCSDISSSVLGGKMVAVEHPTNPTNWWHWVWGEFSEHTSLHVTSVSQLGTEQAISCGKFPEISGPGLYYPFQLNRELTAGIVGRLNQTDVQLKDGDLPERLRNLTQIFLAKPALELQIDQIISELLASPTLAPDAYCPARTTSPIIGEPSCTCTQYVPTLCPLLPVPSLPNFWETEPDGASSDVPPENIDFEFDPTNNLDFGDSSELNYLAPDINLAV